MEITFIDIIVAFFAGVVVTVIFIFKLYMTQDEIKTEKPKQHIKEDEK